MFEGGFWMPPVDPVKKQEIQKNLRQESQVQQPEEPKEEVASAKRGALTPSIIKKTDSFPGETEEAPLDEAAADAKAAKAAAAAHQAKPKAGEKGEDKEEEGDWTDIMIEEEKDDARVSETEGAAASPTTASTSVEDRPNDDEDEERKDDSFASALGGFKPRGAGNVQNVGDEEINFLQDKPEEMTWSRRIAMDWAEKYAWYNPRLEPKESNRDLEEEEEEDGEPTTFHPFYKTKEEKPSLAMAWAYFEHLALPRYIVKQETRGTGARQNGGPPQQEPPKSFLSRLYHTLFSGGDVQLERAEPGEDKLPTKLYNPFLTPHSQLGDWGLGVGLYFSTVHVLAVLMFMAGIINVTNIAYFHSNEYSKGQESLDSFLVMGSAICTDRSWVPCDGCNPSDFEPERFARVLNETAAGELYFALKNNCEGATWHNAGVNFASMIFIIVGIFGLNKYMEHMEIKFDEDEQTAQDYSVLIDNPPPDATDPDEWKQFFYDNFDGAHVTVCTVGVDNDLLVRTLVQRREVLRKIEIKLEPGTILETLRLANVAAKEERARNLWTRAFAKIVPGVPELFAQVVALNVKIQGLAQQTYPATKIFVTFETEEAQRRVLKALTVGSKNVTLNNLDCVSNPKHLFRGNRVLSVMEPDEPSTIRWHELNEKWTDRLQEQALTTFCTFVSIILIALVTRILNDMHVFLAANAITVFNSVFPMFAKMLTANEAHASESGKQRSLYFKIALFRWVNTAIVFTIITPFTFTLSSDADGLIPKIATMFFAEIFTNNIIQLADFGGNFSRHYSAPRAKSQDAMNLAMQGSVMELAERYTNMTKVLFLALWYCAIFPATFFLCSFALFAVYFVDRFSLMRSWKRAPALGTTISEFSRRYFFTTAVVAMALVSSYYWAAFPFDNLCENETPSAAHVGENWMLDLIDGSRKPVTVSDTDTAYRHCKQDFFRYNNGQFSFPFISSRQQEGWEWMTDEQEQVTDFYGWSALVVIGIVACSFMYRGYQAWRDSHHGSYEARGKDQGIPFSEVPSISAYIPQVESPVYPCPLLACSLKDLDTELLEWDDPNRPYSFYDMTIDADILLKQMDVSSHVVFSRVAHYPPPHHPQPPPGRFDNDDQATSMSNRRGRKAAQEDNRRVSL